MRQRQGTSKRNGYARKSARCAAGFPPSSGVSQIPITREIVVKHEKGKSAFYTHHFGVLQIDAVVGN